MFQDLGKDRSNRKTVVDSFMILQGVGAYAPRLAPETGCKDYVSVMFLPATGWCPLRDARYDLSAVANQPVCACAAGVRDVEATIRERLQTSRPNHSKRPLCGFP